MPVRFIRRGVSKARWLPAVAGSSPTRAEINAGINLGGDLAAINGNEFNGSRVPVPVLDQVFTPQTAGEDTVGDVSLLFQDDSVATTIRTTLAKGTAGYLLLMPYGDVATKRCEVWPATSMGVNDGWGDLGNNPAQYTINLAITAPPVTTGTVPA